MSGLVLLGLRILAAVALYAFLGGAFLLLWRTIKQEAQAISSRQVTALTLLIQTPEELEKRINFTQGSVVIGRDPDCDCVVLHNTVSARHARLAFHHGQWWIDDLFSTNGTRLNDDPLQMPTVVVNGDKIKCGQITLTVSFKTESHKNIGGSE